MVRKNRIWLSAVIYCLLSGLCFCANAASWINGENIATTAKVTASTTGGDATSTPYAVNDGIIESTGSGPNKWFIFSSPNGQWLQFDFETSVSIGGARVVSGPMIQNDPDITSDFSIQYFDGNEWKDAYVVRENTEYDLVFTFDDIVTSTKFRFLSRQNKRFRIREIELYEAKRFGSNVIRADQLKGTKYHKVVEVLSNIGFLKYDQTFDPEDTVSKGEFLTMLLKLTGNYDYNGGYYRSSYEDIEHSEFKDVIIAAELLGYVGKDGKTAFYPLKEITYTEAAQMMVSALGYSTFAEYAGGYPSGYLKYAADLKLNQNVSVLNDDIITFGDVLIMFFNMLDAEVCEPSYDGTRYDTVGTFLEVYYNVHKTTGIVTSNHYVGITELCSDSEVMIDGVKYFIGRTDVTHYVGYKVEFYYRINEDNERELIYVSEHPHNTIYEIKADDVLPTSDFNTIWYDQADQTKPNSIPLDYNAYVFLNGELGEAYVEDLKPTSGKLVIIDNDGDGSGDVVFIHSWEYLVVSNISNEVIYDKLSPDSLDLKNFDILNVYKNGEESIIDAIAEDDVLFVEENSKGRFVTIYASDKKVKGIIEAIEEENGKDYVYIDEQKYRITANCKDTVQIGIVATFYMDYMGMIAYVSDMVNTSVQYGILTRIYKDHLDRVYAKIMDENGKFNMYQFENKIYYNDNRILSKNLVNEDGKFINKYEKFESQLVKFVMNQKGYISRLYTGSSTEPITEPNLLTTKPAELVRYKDANDYYFRNGILTKPGLDRTLIIGNDTLVFIGPENDGGSEDDDYSVSKGKNGLKTGYWYGTTNVFDLDYRNIPSAVYYRMEKRAEEISLTSAVCVISSVSKIVNEDKETGWAIEFYQNGIKKKLVLFEDCLYNTAYNQWKSPFGPDYSELGFDRLQIGDIIQYSAKDNIIQSIRILARACDLVDETMIQAVGGEYANVMPLLETCFGTAYCVDSNVLRVKIGNTVYTYSASTLNVYIYERENNRVIVGTVKDIIGSMYSDSPSKIFVRANAKVATDVMIVK